MSDDELVIILEIMDFMFDEINSLWLDRYPNTYYETDRVNAMRQKLRSMREAIEKAEAEKSTNSKEVGFGFTDGYINLSE